MQCRRRGRGAEAPCGAALRERPAEPGLAAAFPPRPEGFQSDRRLREAAEVVRKNKPKGRVLPQCLNYPALNTHVLQVKRINLAIAREAGKRRIPA